MGRSSSGLILLRHRLGVGITKPSQWLPRFDRRYVLVVGKWEYHLQWQPRRGLYVLSAGPLGSTELAAKTLYPDLWSQQMKRLSLGQPDGGGRQPLPSDSVLFKKLPRLMEFITQLAYEDGTPRAPGYYWVKTDATAFIVTLFDEDACARLPCRGATVEDAFGLADKLLGAENAPWEVDQWMMERKAKKKKK